MQHLGPQVEKLLKKRLEVKEAMTKQDDQIENLEKQIQKFSIENAELKNKIC